MTVNNNFLFNTAQSICTKPWEYYVEPFKVCNGVYYVGISWVASYLIDTGDGLILIDCLFRETLYQLFENIRKLGFSPKDIKKLLISHGHADHCGAARDIKEYTGCDIYFPREDLFMLENWEEYVFPVGEFIPFFPDYAYVDGGCINLGNCSIKTIKTPGHTMGTTSFFFQVRDGGERLTLAMHGGLGGNTLDVEYLTSHNLPLSLRDQYVYSLQSVMDIPVDIVLPSHPTMQGDIVSKSKDIGEDAPQKYIDKSAWKALLTSKLNNFTH
ncbi:MAG: MBL fold metallo-hydrolase [Clostridiales bacterium]|nr:MBL fold metallo-hydrolase [Clostridiales bacterium]